MGVKVEAAAGVTWSNPNMPAFAAGPEAMAGACRSSAVVPEEGGVMCLERHGKFSKVSRRWDTALSSYI
jgi:hypothetical protein